VFLMDAEPERPREGMATVLVDWTADERQPRAFAFVASESRFPPALDALIRREWEARLREEMNSLYVALTRAERQIVFSRTEPHQPADGPSWWLRLHGLAQPWSPQAAQTAGVWPDAAVLNVLPGLTRAPRSPAAAPDAQSRLGADARAAALGRSVHRLLEWAASAAWPAQALADAGVAACAEFGLGAQEAPTVAAMAQRILASPQAGRFFDTARIAWAGNEVGVIADDGRPVRIDRLVAFDEGGRRAWWVLDYKLAHTPQEVDAYRDQLASYAGALRRLQPGDAVHMAFISGAGEVIEVEARALPAGE
jgi:ATP-dependent helicase/nuclease subunit A